MTQNFTHIFHVFIITTSLLVFTACGYKGDPVYVDKNAKVETIK
jgi:predicted small lipoprotein YifL